MLPLAVVSLPPVVPTAEGVVSASMRSIDCWISTTRARMSSSVVATAAGRVVVEAVVEAVAGVALAAGMARNADRNGAASGGAEISRVARIVFGVAVEPY